MTNNQRPILKKHCPRCQASFECKVEDVANCQCNAVKVQAKTNEFLASAYYDCLCKNCLAQIDKMLLAAEGQNFPSQKEMLKEGLHYYKEKGKTVYTEFYHLLRGQCCQKDDCTHCAYGFL